MFRELSIVDALPKLIVLRRSRLRWEQHVQSMVGGYLMYCETGVNLPLPSAQQCLAYQTTVYYDYDRD